MRGPTFRGQLLAAFVGLVVVAEAVAVIALDRSLGQDLIAQLDARLVTQAEGAASWISIRRVDREGGEPHFDRHADRLAKLVGAWVTIIDEDGHVQGDSDLAEAARTVDVRADEIAAARRGEVGRAIRWSDHHQADIYFVAVSATNHAVVRLGMPLSAIEVLRSKTRVQLALSALFAAVIAIGLGVLAATRIARPVVGERDRLSAILRGMVEGVLVVNATKTVVLANPSSATLLGEDALGKPIASVLPGATPGAHEIERADRTLLVTMQELEVGAVLVLHDVTERQRLERLRRDFIAQISHEIRTPVASIQGYAETLIAGKVDGQTQAEFLEVIHRQALRIGRLVSALLRLAELEARAPEALRDESIAIDGVVAHVIETVRERALEAQVTITSDVPVGLAARGDGDDLEQVVENLVDNAIRYGARPGKVRISASRRGDRVELVVADDGAGIAAEHLPRIFERFYRVDPARSRKLGGTGLGLAIVERLVTAMRGEVRAESAPGAGTRFVVSLPATAASASPRE